LLGLEAYLHKVLDSLLLLDGRLHHIDPENIIETEIVEELGIGIANNFVVLLQVDSNHLFSILRDPKISEV
jgi:hypothetical protein